MLRKLGTHVTNTLPATKPAEHRPTDLHRAKDKGLGGENPEVYPTDQYGHPKVENLSFEPKVAVLLGQQKPPKIEPFKLNKPAVPAQSMQGQAQVLQPSQWDLQAKAPKIPGQMKISLDRSTMLSYLGQRAAQGAGGANALKASLQGTTGATSREMVQGMSGLQKHRLQSTMQAGAERTKAQGLPSQVGFTEEQARLRAAAATPMERLTHGGVQLGQKSQSVIGGQSYGPGGISTMTGISPAAGQRSIQQFRSQRKSPQMSGFEHTQVGPMSAGTTALSQSPLPGTMPRIRRQAAPPPLA